ncbi:MAG: flagellar hook-basal body complex protein, partial [Desulfovibrio sp.]|nr:flagellar hook-basal body complex protein [Desulfovibrio sp.]
TYSNNQSMSLWQIPVCRFTSEDGLRREGDNLFSASPDAGQMEMGVAGTENYGTIRAYNTENSNVDMATEMTNMIINQRGFQSNSKVVTTADQMLQKAVEMKR